MWKMNVRGTFILPIGVLVTAFYSVFCNQNTYKFIHEYAELAEHNPSLVDIKLVCNKLSRTSIGVNISFTPLVDIASDDDLQVMIVGYQFRSNEYRYGPIDFEMGACSLLGSTTSNMPGILSDTNLTGCPLQQLTYRFIHEYAKISEYNKSIMDATSMCRKINRTTMAVNISMKLHVDVNSDDDFHIRIIGYQFRSNEYRKGPIDFILGGCAAIGSKNFDIPQMLSDSNLRGCPLKKGNHYYIHNMIPNVANFPPYIPEGRWMLELSHRMRGCLGYTLQWFARVENIFPFKF